MFFHLDPKAHSTVTLVNALTANWCFDKLQVARLSLHHKGSEGWITCKVKMQWVVCSVQPGPHCSIWSPSGFPDVSASLSLTRLTH